MAKRIKSGLKRRRQNEVRRNRNRAVRTRVRNAIKALRGAIASNDPAQVKELLAANRLGDRRRRPQGSRGAQRCVEVQVPPHAAGQLGASGEAELARWPFPLLFPPTRCFPGGLVKRGKVRDVYKAGDETSRSSSPPTASARSTPCWIPGFPARGSS